MKACYNYVFHLDRVIAWLNEVATVAHNNTSFEIQRKKELFFWSFLVEVPL